MVSFFFQAYQRLQIQQQMMQAQRNVSGPIRQQEQQVSQQVCIYTHESMITKVIRFLCETSYELWRNFI